MSQPPAIRSVAQWGVVPISLIVSAVLVWQSSDAAFSAATDSPSSNWTSGTVMIADDDVGAALFTATGLTPGASGTKCIVVTSTGSLASAVKLYATSYSNTNALGSYVGLEIDEGSGGTFSTSGPTSCAGFTPDVNDFTGTLAAFATKTSFATGVSSWMPASSSASRTFRIAYSMDAATPNTAQGGSAAVSFTWEGHNS
jgi:hypothetical protein